jgi:hypothetical protein
MLNKQLFSSMMTMLCELYNRQQTQPLIDVYYLVLKQMGDEEFKASMMMILEKRVYASMPKPAEILEFAKPNLEAIASLALSDLERAIAKGGRNMSLIFDDKIVHSVINALGGWIYICNMELRDWEFKRKEFTRLYILHSKRSSHPDHIAGMTERLSGQADGQTGEFARVKASYILPDTKIVKALNSPKFDIVAQLASSKRVTH